MVEGLTPPWDPRDRPLYGLVEAAHYLHLPPSTLRGWLSGWDYRTKRGIRRAQPLIRRPPARRREALLSFYDLVECHVLASLRRVHGIPMYKVRKAIRRALAKKRADRPLLSARLSAEGLDLFPDGGRAHADENGQGVFFFAVERPFGRVDWDPGGARPIRLYPWLSGDDPEGPMRVVIDPSLGAGRPVIAGTTILTATVAARHRAGVSIDALAVDYGLDPPSIEDALLCEAYGRSQHAERRKVYGEGPSSRRLGIDGHPISALDQRGRYENKSS